MKERLDALFAALQALHDRDLVKMDGQIIFYSAKNDLQDLIENYVDAVPAVVLNSLTDFDMSSIETRMRGVVDDVVGNALDRIKGLIVNGSSSVIEEIHASDVHIFAGIQELHESANPA